MPKTFSNLCIIASLSVLFFAVLIYPPYMKQAYVGTPDFNCQVYEHDKDGNLIYETKTLYNEAGKAFSIKEPILKKYYFPLQEIELINGMLNIRLQYVHKKTDETVERYCAFDIFPPTTNDNTNGEGQSAKQKAMRKWYNQLKASKEALEKANTIKKLSEMSEEEMEQIARGMSKSPEESVKQTAKANKNLDKFKAKLGEQIAKRKAEQKEGEGEQGDGEGQSQSKGKGIKPGKGLNITLPSETQNNNPDQESGEVPGESSANPNGSWESSNGPSPREESNRQDPPSKDN